MKEKKQIRKIYMVASIVLILLLQMCLPVISLATTVKITDESEFTYRVDTANSTVTITGYTGNLQVVNIPQTIAGKRVTIIGDSAFDSNTNVTNITIPEGVTTIEYWAFLGCSNLTNVTIPNSVTNIGEGAFEDCSKLSSITLPEGITKIEERTFYGCSNLTNITIPNSVASIGKEAFEGCSSLTSMVLPKGITTIAQETFYGCSNLTNITIPNSVTSIGKGAFEGCTNLTNVTIPEGVTKIEERTFFGARKLTNIILPNGITEIGESAFQNCDKLVQITIPNSVTTIGTDALKNLSPDIVIYCELNSVAHQYAKDNKIVAVLMTDLYEYVMNQDETLTITKYKGADAQVTIPKNIEGKLITRIGNGAFKGNTQVIDMILPNSVKTIESNAFAECTNLRDIDIPSSVTTIDEKAFEGSLNVMIRCEVDSVAYQYAKTNNKLWKAYNENYEYYINQSTLEVLIEKYLGTGNQVVIPERIEGTRVTRIAEGAFRDNTTITSVVLPNTLNSIAESAFAGCSNLIKVTIPVSVTRIAKDAFTDASKVSIRCQLNSYAYEFARENAIEVIIYGDNNDYEYKIKQDNTIEIMKYIGSNAQVYVPSNFNGQPVVSIGKGAFANNSNLREVTLPEGIARIEESAFFGCTQLRRINFSSSVTYIGIVAFYKCTSLREVEIPSTVTTIESQAFNECPDIIIYCEADSAAYQYASKNKIEVVANNTQYVFTINEDNTLTIIEFKGADLYLTIPAKIGDLKVKNIPTTFSENLISIEVEQENEYYTGENGVLYNKNKTLLLKYPSQKAETEYSIPNGVTKIGTDAFINCKNLINIEVPKTVMNLSQDTFTNGNTVQVNYVIQADTTKEQLQQHNIVSGEYTVLKQDNTQLEDTSNIGTGMKIQFTNQVEYTIIVKGDINGDGKIGVVDLTKVKRQLVGMEILEGLYQKAGDTTNKGRISVVDLVKIKRAIVGLEKI